MEGPEIKFAEVEIDNGIHGKRHVRFETGRLAKQAAGSVLVTIDDETTLLSATAIGKSPRAVSYTHLTLPTNREV